MSEDCGKATYPNPITAWKVILTFTKPEHWLKHKEIERPVRAYHCPQCHHWHLTTQHLPRKPHPDHSLQRISA